MVHGGILSAALDDMMGYSTIIHNKFAVTANLEVNFLIPTPVLKEFEIFRQGFCKSCFYENPAAGDWVMRPELSKAHLNQADRDLEYEKKIQLQPHIIYLALSSHLKVGVTRKTQIPTRWIDQGAHEAMTIIEVPNRYLAGIGEVALKEYFSAQHL